MTITNKRARRPQGVTINGIDAGGVMTAMINAGHDARYRATPDGLQIPVSDREIQFVRGSITTQDWTKIISILTGTLGTYVCYERKSGVAEALGYKKHTITNPVISSVNLRFAKGGYAVCSANFECRASDITDTIADMWAIDDGVAAPTYISAARGGYRIEAAVHGAASIYHVTGFDFNLNVPIAKACNDSDLAYTAVDQLLDNMVANGSISFEDTTVASLLTAARANLVLTITQSRGAADKTLTVAGVEFDNLDYNSDSGAEFTGIRLNYEVVNDPDTPLTLAGANKIITIA